MASTEFRALTAEQVREVLKVLRSSQRRMERIVRSGRGSDFDQFVAIERRQAIEREIDALEAELTERLADGTERAALLARARDARTAAEPGSFANMGVDSNVIALAQRTAAAEVRKVTAKMRAELNTAVTRAVAGYYESRTEFDNALRDAFAGRPGDAPDHRIERIARVELGRAFSQQQAAGDEQLARAGSDLIKVWSHPMGRRADPSGRSRQCHQAIHGQERELWQLFNVGCPATWKTPPDSDAGHKANAPLDPTLPAEEAINCRCTVVRRPRSMARTKYIPSEAPERV